MFPLILPNLVNLDLHLKKCCEINLGVENKFSELHDFCGRYMYWSIVKGKVNSFYCMYVGSFVKILT